MSSSTWPAVSSVIVLWNLTIASTSFDQGYCTPHTVRIWSLTARVICQVWNVPTSTNIISTRFYSVYVLPSLRLFSVDFLPAFSCDFLFYYFIHLIISPFFSYLISLRRFLVSPIFSFFNPVKFISYLLSIMQFFSCICILFFFQSFVVPFFFSYCILSFLRPVFIFLYILTYTFKSYYFSLRYIILVSSFKTLQRATIGFVMSVHPSLRPSTRDNSALTGRIFVKFYTVVSGQTGYRTQLRLRSNNNSGILHGRRSTFVIDCSEIFLGYEKY